MKARKGPATCGAIHPGHLAHHSALFLWQGLRIPILGLLWVLEPLVHVGLRVMGLLCLITAPLYYAMAHTASHPAVLGLLGLAIACGVIAQLYETLLRRLSR
jgi:hypothetical protein